MTLRFLIFFLLLAVTAHAQENKFYPMDDEWPTPNHERRADGAPGPDYWQQRADYEIHVTLDEEKKQIEGRETITYYNNSPFGLEYLWVQLDQNRRALHSHAHGSRSDNFLPGSQSGSDFLRQFEPFSGGLRLESLTDAKGQNLPHKIQDSNVRIELKETLRPGKSIRFQISWSYPINDATLEGRSGYETLSEPIENDIFEIAQFYPRMCTYDNVKGWQNMPFLGPGEFALEFGNFEVHITVPADHVVAATGSLQNEKQVLTAAQQKRLAQLKNEKPTFVITPAEARENLYSVPKSNKTWIFKAENVRDFAFASSRTFIWDAATTKVGDKTVRVQSFYPPVAQPLWDTYATHAAIHTLQSYSHYSFDYPYPQVSVVHGPVWGMEYPMLAFCGGRPTGGTYTQRLKHAMISVVMHEVGHNFFPMIVNSDERRWAWMDEGLNSFLQFLTERTFAPNYPARRGIPEDLADYWDGKRQNPIMTNVESIKSNGGTSYEKTATGLNILRETILGRETFDRAFREYAQRWMFKHPEPADFFRTMEDVSGEDLDWFWRNWFYGSEPVDLAVSKIVRYRVEGASADVSMDRLLEQRQTYRSNLSLKRTAETVESYYVDEHAGLVDESEDAQDRELQERMESQLDALRDRVGGERLEDIQGAPHIYYLEFENVGGCPMPLIYEVGYADGSSEEFRIPAHIWMKNNRLVRKKHITEKEIQYVKLDPHRELPDIDRSNNEFPRKIEERWIRVDPGR